MALVDLVYILKQNLWGTYPKIMKRIFIQILAAMPLGKYAHCFFSQIFTGIKIFTMNIGIHMIKTVEENHFPRERDLNSFKYRFRSGSSSSLLYSSSSIIGTMGS